MAESRTESIDNDLTKSTAGAAPMRVAMVAACPFPANHGTPGAIREIAVHLAKLGHDVHVVTYPQYEDIPTDGLTIHRVSTPWGKPGAIKIGPSYERLVYDFLMIGKLIRVIQRHDLQVIHSHNYEGAMIGAIAKLVVGRRMIYNGINSMADELPSYRFIWPPAVSRWIGRILDYVVPRTGDVSLLLSDELKEYLEGLGIAERKLVVIPPGVDVDMFAGGDAAAVRARHQLADDTPLVMYTGALEPFQRLDYMLEAMRKVLDSEPHAKLLIAGNIKNEKARMGLEALASQLGILESILFVDEVGLADLPDYLAAADVAVVPRPSCPGYPVKLLNYMAAGKAIVSFEGSAKSLCQGYNGYVARNHDVDDMAAGIKLLLDNPGLRKTLGQRARESIAGVYDCETLAKGTALIYRQVIDGGRLDKGKLFPLIKGSYQPSLPEAAAGPVSGDFLRAGPLRYLPFPSAEESAVRKGMAAAS